MKDEQILKKAYDKAMNNGWDKRAYLVATSFLIERGLASHTYRVFIFSHSFAKAIFGEEDIDSVIGTCPAYLWYLCKMVREEEPLKYLKQFL